MQLQLQSHIAITYDVKVFLISNNVCCHNAINAKLSTYVYIDCRHSPITSSHMRFIRGISALHSKVLSIEKSSSLHDSFRSQTDIVSDKH